MTIETKHALQQIKDYQIKLQTRLEMLNAKLNSLSVGALNPAQKKLLDDAQRILRGIE